ncbi:MAG: lipase family alpha/beta hydrolase [Candidatus Brocadiia bacterium]
MNFWLSGLTVLGIGIFFMSDIILGADEKKDQGAEKTEIQVEYNREELTARVRIIPPDGKVRWEYVLRGLLRAKGFDDKAFEDIELPLPPLDLNVKEVRWIAIPASNELSERAGIKLQSSYVPSAKQKWVFDIELDYPTLLSSKRRFKSQLRQVLTGSKVPGKPKGPHRNYGMNLDKGWQEEGQKKLVLLIHGLHSEPRVVSGILTDIRKLGFHCGTFCYPNDQPIIESAKSLSKALKEEIARKNANRRVAIVTTSMGGLVARAVVENPGMDPGNVVQLIMIAPPNHGSRLAYFAFGLELWEYGIRDKNSKAIERFFASIEDGLSEAAVDLRPDSPFLRELNSRPRNPDVSYSILLGSGAPMDEGALVAARMALMKAEQDNRFVRFFGPRLEKMLKDLDEVVRGKGDGAVAIKRGKLEGVKDIEVIPFDHGMMFRGKSPAARQLRDAILKRLQEGEQGGGED